MPLKIGLGLDMVAVGLGVGGGLGLPAIPAVIYDGVGDYLKHTGGPSGASDGATLTFVWAGTFNADGKAMVLLDIPGTVPVQVIRNTDNTIDFIGGTSGAVFSNSTSAVAASLGFLAILCSCNGTTSVLKVVHAAGTITGTNTPGAASDLDLTADWCLGSNGGASEFLDADTAMSWADDSEIDMSVADNIEQFWDTTNDLLRYPGPDGSNPTDGAVVPLICHANWAASHTVNLGSGGDADAGGVSDDGVSPGVYSPDVAFTPIVFSWRFYDDVGTEATSGPLAAEKTGVTLDPATEPSGDVGRLGLRLLVQETGGINGKATDDWEVKLSYNGGADEGIPVRGGETPSPGDKLIMAQFSSLANDAATTNRATNGITDPSTGSFIAGIQKETNSTIIDYQLTAGNFTEHHFMFRMATDLTVGDTIDLSFYCNGSKIPMSPVPRWTVA